ncbi:Ribosomal large subunit pseudouridine synthase D [Rubripirellula lacrimiformis]|uniref:Pseudouridine synthase n=1 Tax=Rubripirellula lacrimiformis TaxID=1930273 RepID=A0A517NBP7_9BACT|nr:RluA family pseudouridine synthase [Rubripirellula lacrimiformis]QDT04566.1 Ribosomal large subunit pseudouridine synthase D [Rubripirellula lacrimiformis]
MPLTTAETTILPEQAGRVDAIVRELTQISHSQVRGLIDHGCVTINGASVNDGGEPVAEGDQVSIRYDANQRYREKKKIRWADRTFTIVHEDDALIVVDKAAGTLTVPTDHHESNTLVDRVTLYLSHSKRRRQAFVIHRLDREVSGLLVMGKNQEVADKLIEQFKHRKPNRVYAAIVAGVMTDDAGTFDSHLATGNNLDRYVTGPSKNAERAVTHYKVIRRMEDTTHVEVTLDTGKRNQIRVQFAHAGHPVLGDPRYKTDQSMHARWIRKRIALHAMTLGFEHPVSGKPMTLESKLPAAMQKFLAGGVGRQK